MPSDALLAEKLAAYRSGFELACSGLFGGGGGLTLEYDDGGDAAPTLEQQADPRAVEDDVAAALRAIAEDFAATFNARLDELARADVHVAALAPRYEMGVEHVGELADALRAPVAPLLGRLAAGDVAGARRAVAESWPPLERRLRAKWQAYFVLTFQDVSVERKAVRDRRRPRATIDPLAFETTAGASGALRRLPDLAAPSAWSAPRRTSPWVAVLLVLALAAVGGGWLLARDHLHAEISQSAGAGTPTDGVRVRGAAAGQAR